MESASHQFAIGGPELRISDLKFRKVYMKLTLCLKRALFILLISLIWILEALQAIAWRCVRSTLFQRHCCVNMDSRHRGNPSSLHSEVLVVSLQECADACPREKATSWCPQAGVSAQNFQKRSSRERVFGTMWLWSPLASANPKASQRQP